MELIFDIDFWAGAAVGFFCPMCLRAAYNFVKRQAERIGINLPF
jgi:hypothetical protein